MATLSCPCPGIFDILPNLIELINGSSVAIEVVPEHLVATAEQVNARISSVSAQLENMIATMNSVKGYWEGSRFEHRETVFRNNTEYMRETIRLLNVYVSKLQLIARNYIATEDRNEEVAQTLPTSVIS